MKSSWHWWRVLLRIRHLKHLARVIDHRRRQVKIYMPIGIDVE